MSKARLLELWTRDVKVHRDDVKLLCKEDWVLVKPPRALILDNADTRTYLEHPKHGKISIKIVSGKLFKGFSCTDKRRQTHTDVFLLRYKQMLDMRKEFESSE
jgi:hypothetical protein